MPESEIVFEVWESLEGGYEACAMGHSIFTEADDWEHLEFMLSPNPPKEKGRGCR